MLIWKIAWRNLWRHKEKTLIIGVILCFGALLMTVGNAVLEGANQGLRENLVNRMIGHLILINGQENTQNIFFMGMTTPLKLIPEYARLKKVLDEQEVIQHFVPMSRGYAMMLSEDVDAAIMTEDTEPSGGLTLLFGVDFEQYQKTFQQNVVALEGALLKKDEQGLLITDRDRKKIYDHYNIWLVPQGHPVSEKNLPPEARAAKDQLRTKDSLVFLGLSGESLESDIRLPIKGIVQLENLNVVWRGSFVDIESFRTCFGYFTAAHNTAILTEEETELLAIEDKEDFFAESTLIEDMGDEVAQYYISAMQQQTTRSEINTDDGAYQFVVVKLNSSISIEDGAALVDRVLREAGFDLKMLTWQQAAGSVAQLAAMAQGALFVFVCFLFFVAAIVIMNTISMTVIDRTEEIGMMRTIGAQKGFIRRMFLAEIAQMALFFGSLGMGLGIVIAVGLSISQIPTGARDMLSILVGGDTLNPIVTIRGFLYGIGQLAVVTALTAIYPVRIAQKVTPLDAIAKD